MKNRILFSTTILSALALVPVAAAEDISSPLYVPSEMEILSETSVSYNRISYKEHKTHKDFSVKEEVEWGIGEEAAAIAAISNRFNAKHLTSQDYNNDLNLDYELGAKKNFRLTDSLISQFGASYYTYNPRSWYGRSPEAKAKIKKTKGNTRWRKELRGEAKIGYQLEEDLTPYVSFNMAGDIDDSDHDLNYSVFAGIHKLEDGWSYDTGLRYEFDDDSNNNLYMQLASDYFLSDTATVGGYADYLFAGSADPKVDYEYSLEARLKILF